MLETAIIEGARSQPPGCVVVDGLEEFSRRWGAAKAVAFFSRVCPRLFDLGAIAYWRAPSTELGRSFIDQITNVTQCVLEIGEGYLRVVKAEGRPASAQGRLLRLELADGQLHLDARHPRTPADASTALLDDPQVRAAGLPRAAGGRASPARPTSRTRAWSWCWSPRGWVQLIMGDDTPVLRAGDVALATTVAVSGWRNLLNGPALLFWVLRDEARPAGH